MTTYGSVLLELPRLAAQEMVDNRLSALNNSSITTPSGRTFSSPTCTKQLPLSCSSPRASCRRCRRYAE